MRIDRDTVHQMGLTFREYRKVGTTTAAGVGLTEPCVVVTKEGEYELPVGWEGHIAIDADGDPYPIEAGVFDATYEEVEE